MTEPQPPYGPPAHWQPRGTAEATERLRREWAALVAELGQAWWAWHSPSRAWWMTARRVGIWYAVRFVRARLATPAEAADAGLAQGVTVRVVQPHAVVIGRAVRVVPWWCPSWAWRIWYPEPRRD